MSTKLEKTPMAKILPFNSSARLPTGEFDEKHACERFAFFWGHAMAILGIKDSDWLQPALEDGLLAGHLSVARDAIDYANKGERICDAALKNIGAELHMRRLQGQTLTAPAYPLIESYYALAALRARKRGRGRPPSFSLLARDFCICLCTEMVRGEFNLYATRNETSDNPSAISVAAKALALHCGIHLSEATIQEHIWLGLAGRTLRKNGMIK
jgi:hypothetical protein